MMSKRKKRKEEEKFHESIRVKSRVVSAVDNLVVLHVVYESSSSIEYNAEYDQ